MSAFDVLPTLCYVAGLINEIKKSKNIEKECVNYHFVNIFEQINKLILDSNASTENDYFKCVISECKDKLYNIMQKYNNDSNYTFINELEEIKRKLKTVMFLIY